MKLPSRKERNSPKIDLDFELLDALTAAVKAVISNCAQTLNVQSDMAALHGSFMNAAGGLGCLAGGHSGVLIPRRGSLDRPVPSLWRQARCIGRVRSPSSTGQLARMRAGGCSPVSTGLVPHFTVSGASLLLRIAAWGGGRRESARRMRMLSCYTCPHRSGGGSH